MELPHPLAMSILFVCRTWRLFETKLFNLKILNVIYQYMQYYLKTTSAGVYFILILPSFSHLTKRYTEFNPTACSNCRGHVVGPWRSIGLKSVQVGPLHLRGILQYISHIQLLAETHNLQLTYIVQWMKSRLQGGFQGGPRTLKSNLFSLWK